jgi:hypothetical protein
LAGRRLGCIRVDALVLFVRNVSPVTSAAIPSSAQRRPRP